MSAYSRVTRQCNDVVETLDVRGGRNPNQLAPIPEVISTPGRPDSDNAGGRLNFLEVPNVGPLRSSDGRNLDSGVE